VADALALVRARAGQQEVQLRGALPDRPVVAPVDRGQLGTVLVNLLLNALDAMPGGGRLEVGLGVSRRGEITLGVSDTGAGIPEAMASRLFTPFASTKPTGTGLGLCICRRIVEGHGGRIAGENRPAGGARFTITLREGVGNRE
jgi:signal transduction histidine kinase